MTTQRGSFPNWVEEIFNLIYEQNHFHSLLMFNTPVLRMHVFCKSNTKSSINGKKLHVGKFMTKLFLLLLNKSNILKETHYLTFTLQVTVLVPVGKC